MTAPDHRLQNPPTDAANSRLLRIAIWVAIGALIAAALVCVVWVLLSPSDDVIGRAFLTILLLAAFAGVAILDAHLAPRRPAWFALTSMSVWVVTLLAGAFLIWMPYARSDFGYLEGNGYSRFVSFLLIVLVLQLALLHVRLYMKAFLRRVTGFTTAVGYVTIALVTVLALMLVVPLIINEFVDFGDWYWRLVVAISILAAVGTALIPLMNVLFAPRRPQPAPGSSSLAPWPTYVDMVTPLPMLPDGSPDWNAYYTGYPTPGAHVFAPSASPSSSQSASQPPAHPAAQPAIQPAPTSQPSSPQGWPPPQAPSAPPAPPTAVPPAPAPSQAAPAQPTPSQGDWHAPQPAPQRPGTQWPPFQQPSDPGVQAQESPQGFPPPPPLPPQR